MKNNPAVLITGASGGIGSSLAEILLEAGWQVFGTYHSSPGGVPDECEKIECDFSRPQPAAHSLRNQIENSRKSLQALVHCAGITKGQPLHSLEPSDWKLIRKIHLDASFSLARQFYNHLADTGEPGHLVLISSRLGLQGKAGQANYSAAKSALLGLTTSLAAEWAPKVLVNAIQPPLTDSKMTREIAPEKMPEVMQPVLSGQIARPDQTARLLHWLLETDNTSGQLISADNRIHSLW